MKEIDYDDYTVAVDLATGEAIKVWKGERFRNYDETKVHQYKIAMATSANDAAKRANEIFNICQRDKETVKRLDRASF